MKDVFNIVKVSDIDDIDCQKIIRKCYDKPNLINFYYPHVFMNREKINKDELMKLLDEFVLNVKRDKNIDHTIKKYNVLTNILESLFLCVLDLNTVKNIQKFIQYNFSKDDNNIIDIVNSILQDNNILNLEQLLNDKIDNSHSVFVIEKIINHVKKTYTNSNLEVQILTQYSIFTKIQNYIFKLKYNPYINKIINYNKIDLVKEYITKCEVNESHDKYITNIIEIYQEIKQQCYDIVDDCDWNSYFKKVSDSLNISDPKEKVVKSIFRLNILNKIISINNDKNSDKEYDSKKDNEKNRINTLIQNFNSLIDSNKIDSLIINCYINMIKNNTPSEKLVHLENVIKYFPSFGNLSKELIKLIFPKYFSKENTKYYFDVVSRLNNVSNKKLSIIDTIVDQQKQFADDMKITQVSNASQSIFDKDIISIYNVDHKYIDTTDMSGNIKQFAPELNAYNTFTTKWFEKHFANLKKVTVNSYLSNGKIQISNTVINTNLIILNTLFMFNNDLQTVPISKIKETFSDDISEHIITTLNYYNLAIKSDDKLVLNKEFFDTKQEIKVELIMQSKQPEVQSIEETVAKEYDLKAEALECVIIKTIKTNKVHKEFLADIVFKSARMTPDLDLYNKCMKRLFDLDYYEEIDNLIIYVP